MSTVRLQRALGLLGALGLAALGGCVSPGHGFRSDSTDPDARLVELVDAYQRGKGSPYGSRGSAVVDTGRAAQAIERHSFEHPGHVPSLMAVAAISYEQGWREKASSYLDALFRLQAAHPEAGILRSRIAIADGNLPGAELLLRRQVRYRPDHAELREALAGVLFLLGRGAEADTELELALHLGAPAARVAFHQGLVSEARGDAAAAASRYEEALEVDPAFPQARSRLAGLRARVAEVPR